MPYRMAQLLEEVIKQKIGIRRKILIFAIDKISETSISCPESLLKLC